MKVLVTGGNGFLGRRLVTALLGRGAVSGADGAEHEIERVVVSDIGPGISPLPDDPRIDLRLGDFSEPGAAEALLDADTGVVFHLAAVVSGEAEQNFDLGMRINFHSSLRLLDAIRARGNCPRLRVHQQRGRIRRRHAGGHPRTRRFSRPRLLTDRRRPRSSCCSTTTAARGSWMAAPCGCRRWWCVPARRMQPRPRFASAIIREPLEGRAYACPVAEEAGVWLLSPRRVVESFLHAASLPSDAFGMSRALALPGMTVTVREMVAGLARGRGRPCRRATDLRTRSFHREDRLRMGDEIPARARPRDGIRAGRGFQVRCRSVHRIRSRRTVRRMSAGGQGRLAGKRAPVTAPAQGLRHRRRGHDTARRGSDHPGRSDTVVRGYIGITTPISSTSRHNQ